MIHILGLVLNCFPDDPYIGLRLNPFPDDSYIELRLNCFPDDPNFDLSASPRVLLVKHETNNLTLVSSSLAFGH